jgi:hypothetical protein
VCPGRKIKMIRGMLLACALVAAAQVIAEVEPIRPAETLRVDAFDAPVAVSVAEAAKANVGPPLRRPDSGESGQPERFSYVCPMHPEVTSHEPGKCPKCGMALVVQAPKEK